MKNIYLLLSVAIFLLSGKAICQEKSYLSDIDKGYKEIEKVQQLKCHGDCLTMHIDCRKKIPALWKSLYGEDPTQNQIDSSCLRVSTRYEFPGAYRLLKSYLSLIQEAAKSEYGVYAIEPRIGSLLLYNVNAGATSKSGEQLIFVNTGYFSFAHEIGKVTARTIEFKLENTNYSIDTSHERFYELVEEKPELIIGFVEVLESFSQGRVNSRSKLPSETIHPILNVYDMGMEIFAIAHEYGHLLKKHQAYAFNSEFKFDDWKKESNSMKKVNKNSWEQEFEADYIACRLFKNISEKLKKDTTENDFIVAINASPDFYFSSKSYMDNFKAILKNGNNIDEPEKEELMILNEFRKNYQSPGFDISTFLVSQNGKTKNLKDHPHSLIRREVVRMMLPLENTQYDQISIDKGNKDASIEIAKLMSQNGDLLSKVIDPMLKRIYQEGKSKKK